MKQQIEIRVLGLVDLVRRGQRIEDDLVECKSAWPDPDKVARQLGGHANVASGQPLLWLIGVDEDAGRVVGAGDLDVASWWPAVRSKFDDVAPSMQHLAVPVGKGVTIVALVFETDRAPYVVKKGAGDKGRFEREVPWRDGTTTRSAHRHEVLRILGPSISVPSLNVVQASLTARVGPIEEPLDSGDEEVGEQEIHFYLSGRVFFGPIANDVSVLPGHSMRGWVDFNPTQNRKLPPPSVPFSPSLYHDSTGGFGAGTSRKRVDPHPWGVESIRGVVYVRGAGELVLSGRANLGIEFKAAVYRTRLLEVNLELPVAGSTGVVRLSMRLRRSDTKVDRNVDAGWVWSAQGERDV